MRFIFGILLLYTIQPLMASDFNNYIIIQEKETSKFLHQTVRRYGDITRFEVIIGDKDISISLAEIETARLVPDL